MWKSRNLLIAVAAAACALAVAPATAQAAPASGHDITAVAQTSPATNWGWIYEGTYSTEEECEMIGLDYYEDGYAKDYDCTELEGVCPGGWALWLYVPEAESAARPSIEHDSTTAAVQPAC
jgi:hypothetical protein